MGHALDRILELSHGLHGTWHWQPHPNAAGFVEVELDLPGLTEPLDGAGPTRDEAALNLLLAHFPDAIRADHHLQALANEHEP